MNMSDILMPKNQAVVDRLRRRVETYRHHHDDCIPRFDQTTNGLNEQQKQETFQLRQRYLDAKAKKTGKKSDKSKNHGNNAGTSNSNNSSNNGQQDASSSMGVANRLQKRPCEDAEMGSSMGVGGVGGSGENYEPPPKMASMSGGSGPAINGSRPSHPPGTSFNKPKQKLKNPNSGSGTGGGGEMSHHGDFGNGDNPNVKTSSNATNKPGRKPNNGGQPTPGTSTGSNSANSNSSNSTNHLNHVSKNNSMPGSSGGSNSSSYTSPNSLNVELKQESGTPNGLLSMNTSNTSTASISAFDDLDECAAAIEKDAANSNGSSMMASLMGLNGEPEGMIIPSDTLKDLISEISDLNPDFMGDFDFDDDHSMEMSTGISLLANSLNTSSQNGDTGGMNNTVTNTNPMMTNSYGLEMGMYGNNNNMNQCHPAQQQQQQQQQQHGHHNPVAPVTPTASSTNSSPRLGHAKHETDMSTSFSTSNPSSSATHSNNTNTTSTHDNAIGNRGLSHCAGPSPAAASTASPLASQLNSHHPSQTPPYCSTGSAHFDSMSPTAGGGVAQQSHSGSSTPNSNYGPPTRVPTPSSGSKVSNPTGAGGGAAARIPYTSPSVHDSPAAQTLKQMAEQHQHKAQMGIGSYSKSTPPNSNPSPARSPFNGDSYGGGFNNPNSAGSMGGGEYINPSSSPVFPNVRTPSGTEAIQAMMRSNEGIAVTIKQDPNSPYFSAIQQQQQQQQQQSMMPHGPPQQGQGNFSQMDGPGPGMNPAAMSKRQQQQMLAQQSQHHKGPPGPGMTGMNGPGMMPTTGAGGAGPMNPMCNPSGRIPTPTNVNPMLMQQQHSPLHNKSFNTSVANSHLHAHLSSPPVNHHNHTNNPPPPHLQHMMNSGAGVGPGGRGVGGGSGPGQNSAGAIHHHQPQAAYSQQQQNAMHHQQQQQQQQQQQLMYSSNNPNAPQQANHGTSVQMSQSQQMSISQQQQQQQSASNSTMQAAPSGSQQMGSGGGGDVNVMKSMQQQQQQQNMYYRQSSPPQQSLHPGAGQNPANSGIGPPMDPFAMTSNNASNAVSIGGPNGTNNQGQTINFTQQHLRMSSSVSPGVNNPSMSPANSNPMMSRSNSVAGAGMMGMGPNNGGHGNNNAGGVQPLNPMGARMPMPNRMSAGQGGMGEMGMNPRGPSMEMQQRMIMRQMQMRGGNGPPNMSQQQMSMVRGPGPQQMMEYNAELMGAPSASGPGGQVGMMSHSPSQSMMMSRFNGPPGAGGGAGVRQSMMATNNGNPQVISGGGHRLSQQQQTTMYQHQMQQQHGMGQGSASGMPRGSMVPQTNAMSMPSVRGRMSSMHTSASSSVPTPIGNGPMGNQNMNPAMSRDGGNVAFMNSQQQMQGNMNSMNNIPNGMSPQEWMALQQHEQGMNRNFGMQQQQPMRGNNHPNSPAYRTGPGMGMQMSQQQHMMGQMGMAGNNGTNPSVNGGPNTCFNQPQHPHSTNSTLPTSSSNSNGPNPSHFFAQQQQQQLNQMKMSQSQAQMMSGPGNYPHPPSSSMTSNTLHMNKSGNNMTSIAGNGNGGTIIQPNNSNGPIMHPSHHMQPSQQHMMNHHNHHQQQQQGMMSGQPQPPNQQQLKTDSDFNMDLFGSDPSDTDFLNTYDATTSYENILDSLS